MSPARKKIALGIAAMMLVAVTAFPANNAEQVIFSGAGLMTLRGNTQPATPFGFWIWCAFHPSAASTPPTYQAAQVCQGSMYFYALGIPSHVVSAFSIVEDPDGVYTFPVVGLKSPNDTSPEFVCFMHNAEPPKNGPNNTVTADCLFSPVLGGGQGHGVAEKSIVNATGPE
jgi:hypothetical protein